MYTVRRENPSIQCGECLASRLAPADQVAGSCALSVVRNSFLFNYMLTFTKAQPGVAPAVADPPDVC